MRQRPLRNWRRCDGRYNGVVRLAPKAGKSGWPCVKAWVIPCVRWAGPRRPPWNRNLRPAETSCVLFSFPFGASMGEGSFNMAVGVLEQSVEFGKLAFDLSPPGKTLRMFGEGYLSRTMQGFEQA